MKRRALTLSLCFFFFITAFASAPAKFVAEWPPIAGGDLQNISLVGNTLFGYRGSSTAVFDVAAPARIRQVATLNSAFRKFEAADPYVLEYYVGPLRLLDISQRAAPAALSTVGVGIIAVAAACR